MFKQFIDRPVLSTVISIIITILGILGLTTLPVTQYPDIAPPTITVRFQYPGANAQTVMKSAIIPIEEKINGVEGMTYMTSRGSNNGMGQITIYFEPGYDPDIAAVNVQNRVSLATPLLPQEVKQTGVTTQKQQTGMLMAINFYSENPEYGSKFLTNYLNINVTPEMQRVEGVGDVQVYSSRNYAMRIWISPATMAQYGLSPDDVAAAINEQSQEAAAGELGTNTGQSFQYTIVYSGRLEKSEEYENIILKSLGDGKFLRLKDIAEIELGVENYGVTTYALGYPSMSMSIFQTKGSNAQEIVRNIHKKLDVLSKDFPQGIKVFIPYDTNEFLEASINKVIQTLFEAFILVFIVVFLFLQDFRSTLIPAIAVPVSIIGTFFFLNILGYSLNLLTLFALVLAIGIVVDDAIVVVEAVHAKLDGGEKNVRKGTHDAMDEITGAIISITLVMAAVFLPVTFISGPTGEFFKQFGVTLMVAILISALNALTLSPALCAVFLKPHKDENGKKPNLLKRFFIGFNTAFQVTTKKYIKSLSFFTKHKWVTPLVILIAAFGIWWSSEHVSTGFVPAEDRGIIFTNIELPASASLDRTDAVVRQLDKLIKNVPGIENASYNAGWSFLSGPGANYGMGFIKLDDYKFRKTPDKSVDAITGKLFALAAQIPDAKIIFFAPASIPGYGSTGGFEINLLDKKGLPIDELSARNKEFIEKLSARPEILYATSSFRTDYPQYQLDINVPVAKELGVNINSIFRTLQGYIGSIYTADFTRFGKQYRVYLQAPPKDRVEPEDLNRMFVKTGSGEMAPITQFVSLKRTFGPTFVSRFNMFNSTTITGSAAPGYSSGDAIKAIKEVTAQMPAGFDIGYSGLTREEVNATGKTYLIFLLVIIFVYFLLSAQYESYLLPFSILLSVPLGAFGAYTTALVLGMENNIYFQIALVMLIGLLAKNAILIVEFAIQRRRHGETIINSAIDGAKARLRPILMTSFAFILGLLPLATAQGIGAIGNRSIGTTAVSGMLIGTILGIFIIPALYVFFEWLQEKFTGAPIDKNPIVNTNKIEE